MFPTLSHDLYIPFLVTEVYYLNVALALFNTGEWVFFVLVHI